MFRKDDFLCAFKKERFAKFSVVVTLSKEFLQQNGLKPGDEIFVDETKLQAAITKKADASDAIDLAISQILNEHRETFKALVDK